MKSFNRRPLLIPVVVALFATGGLAQADGLNRCARLGADYVAVAGSNGCVRLGGHVRVELRNQPNLAPTGNLAPMGYVAQDGIHPASARIAHQPMPPFDMFPR